MMMNPFNIFSFDNYFTQLKKIQAYFNDYQCNSTSEISPFFYSDLQYYSQLVNLDPFGKKGRIGIIWVRPLDDPVERIGTLVANILNGATAPYIVTRGRLNHVDKESNLTKSEKEDLKKLAKHPVHFCYMFDWMKDEDTKEVIKGFFKGGYKLDGEHKDFGTNFCIVTNNESIVDYLKSKFSLQTILIRYSKPRCDNQKVAKYY